MSTDSRELPEEWSVLLHAVAEESLTDEQEQRLAELLRTDVAFRREYVRHCQLLAMLTWQSSTEPELRIETSDVSERPEPASAQLWRSKTSLKVLRAAAALAGVAAVVLVVGWVWRGGGSLARTSLGEVTGIVGQIEIVREGQSPMFIRGEDLVQNRWPLQSQDLIRIDGNSTAQLVLADRTRIDIGPGTHVMLTASPDVTITLPHGNVTARVTRQSANRALTFITPQAEVRVIGTELELLALAGATEVAVSEGAVQVTRTSDGQVATVSQSQFLSIADSGELSVLDWPQPPDLWSENFEQGLPPGWMGRRVRTGLPEGSRGAVQAVAMLHPTGRSLDIGSPAEETTLFAWHPDSVLHLTFKVQPPAWFHLYLFARTYQQEQPLLTYCCVKPELWEQRPGEWRTVSIPLSEFHPASGGLAKPTLGRIPVRLVFSGPNDLSGVMIDRVWVDRVGSSLVETP